MARVELCAKLNLEILDDGRKSFIPQKFDANLCLYTKFKQHGILTSPIKFHNYDSGVTNHGYQMTSVLLFKLIFHIN